MVWESFKRVSAAPVVQQEPIAPVSVDQDSPVEVSTKTSFGLGDMVAAIAEPIAKASDAVFKTKLKGCGACRKRREMLNTLMPFYKI